jgi:hypothetical protein
LRENAEGPKTLAELQELLGLEAVDVNTVNMNSEETKYKIGE